MYCSKSQREKLWQVSLAQKGNKCYNNKMGFLCPAHFPPACMILALFWQTIPCKGGCCHEKGHRKKQAHTAGLPRGAGGDRGKPGNFPAALAGGRLCHYPVQWPHHPLPCLLYTSKIDRAAGILKTARVLSSSECMELLSYIRLGLSTGVLQGVTTQELNALMVNAQPATLMAKAGKQLDQNQRDIRCV